MKKLTSLLLSAVMLLSAVAGLFETVSAESYVPYVINFDDGESIDRYIPNGNATEQKRKEKFSFEAIAGPQGTVSNVLKINGAVNPTVTTTINQNQSLAGTPSSTNNPYFAGYKITNNACYRYSAWVKLDESVTGAPASAVADLTYRYNKMNADGSAGTVRKSFAEKLYANPGKWVQVVTYFKVSFAGESGKTVRPVALSVDFGTSLKGTVYVDDIEIVQVSEFETYGEPKQQQSITFDDARPYEFDHPAFSVAENAPEKDSKISKALKVGPGVYNKNAVVNINSTLYNQTDMVFAIPVKSGQAYLLKFWAYVPANAADINYAAVILAYKASSTASVTRKDVDFGAQLNAEKGKWVQITANFEPEFTNETEVRKVGISFNFTKTVSADVYIDDITLTETEKFKYYDYNNPQAKESITFDDNRPYEIKFSGYSITNAAPARNGAASKALKLAAGTYTKDAVLNIGTTLYTQTDEAFVVPAKPNQPYLVSAWVYLSEKTPAGGNTPNIGAAYFYAAASNEERNSNEFMSTINGAKGQWVKVEFYIETGANTKKLGLTVNFGKTVPADIYIDDIEIVETTKKTVYDGPQAEQMITFDDNRPYSFDKPQFEIIPSPHARDGKTSNVLHVKEGAYNNTTVINQTTTLTKQTDPVFAIPVTGGKAYKLSAWLFVEEKNNAGQTPENWTYICLYGAEKGTRNEKEFTAAVNRKKGTWVKIEHYIVTNESTQKLGVSLNFAKNVYTDIYIDDIKLENVGPIKVHTTPQDITEITFEDGRPYSFELPDNMAIEDAPARDGKATRALRIYKGEYDYNVCLNQSTLWQGNVGTDMVFSIPVQPNTLYKFSFWVYLVKGNRFPYCSVYADSKTSSTMLDLQARGINQQADKWVQYEVYFLTEPTQTKINTFFNLAKTTPDAYFDDFKLEAYHPGVFRQTNVSYCEEPYNEIYQSGVLGKVTAAATGVYKLNVAKNCQYTFGVTAAAQNSKDKVYLSFDGVTPMKSVVAGVPDAVVTPGSNLRRYSFDFVTNDSGIVYLVVQNPGKTLKLNNPQIFRTLSIAANFTLGSEENPNLTVAPTPTVEVYDYAVSGNPDGTTPDTGDPKSMIPVFLILLMAGAVLVAVGKERVAQNEK